MRDGEEHHLQYDAIIDQSVRDILGRPSTTGVTDDPVRLEVKDQHALPPAEEDHALDAQEFAQRAPIDGVP